MKTIRVVAAIITSTAPSGQAALFATQRGYGPYKDGNSPTAKLKQTKHPMKP